MTQYSSNNRKQFVVGSKQPNPKVVTDFLHEKYGNTCVKWPACKFQQGHPYKKILL